MTLLVIGLSHASAPVTALERAALAADQQLKLARDVHSAPDMAGAAVLSTCNRVEVYADAGTFHGGVAAVSELLARHTGIPLDELTGHLYVHYADRAVQHLLAVACGLESMVIGESQILGQVRRAFGAAREHGTLSRGLAQAGGLALRAGKRAHAQTAIDQAGPSMVAAGVAAALRRLGRADLTGSAVLIVGAGAMSGLAAATAARHGAASLVVVNRTARRARQLAGSVGGTAAPLAELAGQLAAADLVISCTGAAGQVIGEQDVAAALAGRDPAAGPLVLLDLAMPRDVAPGVAGLPGTAVVGLAELAGDGPAGAAGGAVERVRQIVAEEFAGYASAGRATQVTPTVLALRAKAEGVVEAETARIGRKLPGLDDRARQEIAQAMRRIADKLLHAPTVRVKELAGSPGADSYEAALRVLFDLDPAAVRAVAAPDPALADWPDPGPDPRPDPRPGPPPAPGAARGEQPGAAS